MSYTPKRYYANANLGTQINDIVQDNLNGISFSSYVKELIVRDLITRNLITQDALIEAFVNMHKVGRLNMR